MNAIIDTDNNVVVGFSTATSNSPRYITVPCNKDQVEALMPCVYNEVVKEFYSITTPKPSHIHTWNGIRWVDPKECFTYNEYRGDLYPSVREQLDMLFHAMDTGEIPKATAWYNTIKDIKTKHPKG